MPEFTLDTHPPHRPRPRRALSVPEALALPTRPLNLTVRLRDPTAYVDRGNPWHSGVRRGSERGSENAGSSRGLALAHCLFYACGTHGCCALVVRTYALRAAAAAGRVALAPGDGCGRCTGSSRRAEHTATRPA